MGMSLVVRIVGQATLQPALTPRYGMPARTRSRRVEQAKAVQAIEQAKGVAAADEDAVGFGDGPHRIGERMQADEFVAGIAAPLDHGRYVPIVVGQRVRHEGDPANRPKPAAHRSSEHGDAFGRAKATGTEQDTH